jgi:SRSO17 transposase
MSLLELPEAQALLRDAELSTAAVKGCEQRLTRYLHRYLPRFYRKEQRDLATLVIQGRLSGLERKTSEPIAYQAGRHRKPVQHFVGAGQWDDEAVMSELRQHIAEELADPAGVIVLDPSAFPKKGTESCAVARQWCGRLGKVENCQVGVFLAYAAKGSYAPLDRRLYLTEEWAADRQRRHKTHVPKSLVFQEKWRIGLELLDRSGSAVPHAWVVADDEFGRAAEFRAQLRLRRERYILDVPSNTLVRDVRVGKDGQRARFQRADAWARQQPWWRWRTITIRAAEKGPLKVRALKGRVQTREEGRLSGATETLLVIRTVEAEPKTYYALSNADRRERLPELVRGRSERHRIEELFETGNGEAGLDHYEVRSWVGWHHHITLSFLALWFLCLERRRVGGKNPRRDHATNSRDLHPTIAPASAKSRRNCSGRHADSAA